MTQSIQPGNTQVVVQIKSYAPSLPLRFIWFLFIGWWLSGVAIFWGWLFNILIVTLPLGLYILNRIPQIATLRQPLSQWESVNEGGVNLLRQTDSVQRNFWLRAAYFVLIGFWLSLIWLYVAWAVQWTVILLPLTFWMYSKSAFVTTLRQA